jgi:Tfp pilus assembly protein PilN
VALVATVVVAAFAVGWSQLGVATAQGDLDRTQEATKAASAQRAKYADVPKQLAALDAARAAREQALGQDLPWYRLLTDLSLSAPDGTSLTTYTFALADPTAPVAGQDPLALPGIGQVSISGTTTDLAGVTAWLRASAGVPGVAGAVLQSATRVSDRSGSIGFTSSLIITSDALSHRFDRKAG